MIQTRDSSGGIVKITNVRRKARSQLKARWKSASKEVGRPEYPGFRCLLDEGEQGGRSARGGRVPNECC